MVSRKRRGALVGLLAALVAVAAAPAAGTPAPAPRRIVSTSRAITETLFALGLGERVVGVSQFCTYPKEAAARPKVGTFMKPDPEAIARLSPDLVFVHDGIDSLEGRLTALGLRTVVVDRGSRLAGVYSIVETIGTAANVPERATALIAELRAGIARLRHAAAGKPRPRVLLIVGRRPGTLTDIVAVGPASYLGELLEVAGGTNVFDAPGFPAYSRISLETVIRQRPDVIVDTGDMGETPAEWAKSGKTNAALWRDHPLVAASSIKTIHAATTDALVVPGPRVIEAAEWLRGLIQDGVAR